MRKPQIKEYKELRAQGLYGAHGAPERGACLATRLRFPLSSDDCELLLAFELAGSLADLGKAMHKDISVISRKLQAVAELGVLEKAGNRWSLTPLGRQVNQWTRTVATNQVRIFEQARVSRRVRLDMPEINGDTALLLVGMQNGFLDRKWGIRNNVLAEENVARLLEVWRRTGRSVYHIHHHSVERGSPLRFGTRGSEAIDVAQAHAGETRIAKSTNSAFIGTNLEELLRARGHISLVIVGFSLNHCVDATCRSAGDLGFSAFVVADACVAFDRIDAGGSLIRADETARVALANLHQEFAIVTDTMTIWQAAAGEGF